MTRQIDDVLLFRTDISPFLGHLTKAAGKSSAEDVLRVILNDGQLKAGGGEINDIKYGGGSNRGQSHINFSDQRPMHFHRKSCDLIGIRIDKIRSQKNSCQRLLDNC